ncbi:TetR/AcrR family transcriptional regulator [Pseudonocardia cypriaca]|uniref:TetR family transcriptional regulator n=1 Tax=Pseudonocardia cypriaca TaxID=882449 RepID=A0A543GGW5_9PSEU|nr:TetR/AcrR family transcriptional regulator [Pseudonocardia cypriaca]TQM45322.1 TetR family transcriptional regulator [Pseudonocardia cypriaca]
MPRVSEQHLAARRQQILDAAAGLFAERGFARTSMSDVVRESGLSMGAVYRYFPSKADLVIAVGEGRGGEVDGEFPAERARDLLARLAALVGPGSSHARLSVQVWGEAAVEPDLAAKVVPIHRRLESHLAQLLRTEEGPGSAGRDCDAVAQVALAAVIGMAALVAAGVPVDERRFVDVLTELVDVPSEASRDRGDR